MRSHQDNHLYLSACSQGKPLRPHSHHFPYLFISGASGCCSREAHPARALSCLCLKAHFTALLCVSLLSCILQIILQSCFDNCVISCWTSISIKLQVLGWEFYPFSSTLHLLVVQHRILLIVDVHNICWMGEKRRFVTKRSVPTVKMRERINASRQVIQTEMLCFPL